MNNPMLVATLLLLAMFLFFWLVWYLQKKGVNCKKIIDVTKTAIGIAKKVDDVVEPFVPPSIDKVVDKVIFIADNVTSKIEKLYKLQEIEKEQRKDAAMSLVEEQLTELGINIDDDVRAYLDWAIEASVKKLPKTHT